MEASSYFEMFSFVLELKSEWKQILDCLKVDISWWEERERKREREREKEREREWVERNAIKKWEGMKHIAQDNLCI